MMATRPKPSGRPMPVNSLYQLAPGASARAIQFACPSCGVGVGVPCRGRGLVVWTHGQRYRFVPLLERATEALAAILKIALTDATVRPQFEIDKAMLQRLIAKLEKASRG